MNARNEFNKKMDGSYCVPTLFIALLCVLSQVKKILSSLLLVLELYYVFRCLNEQTLQLNDFGSKLLVLLSSITQPIFLLVLPPFIHSKIFFLGRITHIC